MNNDLAITFVVMGGICTAIGIIATAASNNFQACLDAIRIIGEGVC